MFMVLFSRRFHNGVLTNLQIRPDALHPAISVGTFRSNATSNSIVTCESFLSVILVALVKYVNRKFEDFLPGGIYSDPSDELKSKVGSVEKHSKFSERIFAYFDNLLRFKPHINTLASEAIFFISYVL
jgi:hypothetical protein